MWRITIALGYPHPDLLLDELTVHQLHDLMRFYAQEPFGVIRDDLRIGNVAALVFNAMRTKKSDPLHSAMDYLLFSNVPKDRNEKRKRQKSKYNSAVARAQANWNRMNDGD